MRAAVFSFIDASVRVRAISVAERGDVGDVRVLRIHDYATDLTGFAQADVVPSFATIGGLVNAIARGQIHANVGLARPRINCVGIGWGDGESANGSDVLIVENGPPDYARVGGLPDAAVNGTEVEFRRIAGNAGHSDDTTAAKGTNQAPLQRVIEFGPDGLSGGGDGDEAKENDE